MALLGGFLFRCILLQILGRVDERSAVAGHVAHARAGATFLAVHAFGVFAAGHLQAPWCTGKFHALVGGGGDVLERDAAPADQIGRARQHLQRGNAAGKRSAEAWVLRPDRVLGPHVGRHRCGHLVAVAMRADARAGIHAQMRVHIDDAGGHPLAGAVDTAHVCGRLERLAHRSHLAIAQQHVGIVQPLAGAGEHGGVLDQHRSGRERAIGAGVGILHEARCRRCRRRRPAQHRRAQRGEQDGTHGFPR